MGNGRMTVTMLGTGTSTGIPVIGCDCAVCRSANPRNKRLRTSALLHDEKRRLLIDCGPDFREQALRANLRHVDGVLVTHSHADHVSGLDDLRIYNFRQKAPVPIRAAPAVLDDIRKRFDYCFSGTAPEGGGLPKLDLQQIDGAFEWFGLNVVPVPLFHGELAILGFRIGDFAYLTDASRIPEESFALLGGVRTLVLNALRRRAHATHFSLDEAVAIAERIGAQQTWFVHMCHDLDHDATNASLPPDKQLAWDGLEFDFATGAF